MARSVAQYVFAALLALLSAQAAMPSAHVVATGIAWCAESDQEKTSDEVQPIRAARRDPRPISSYRSRTKPEPEFAALFQRPPPAVFLF
jgi:hypothetical protein